MVALFLNARTASKQAASDKKQADLAAALHEQLIRDQAERLHADFRAWFVKNENTFVLENVGDALARDVQLAAANSTQEMPILDVDTRFPIREFRPKDQVRLIAAVSYGVKIPYPITLTWKDDAGLQQRRIAVDYR